MDSTIAKVIGRLIADYDHAYALAKHGDDIEKRYGAFHQWQNAIRFRDLIFDTLKGCGNDREAGDFYIQCYDATQERLARLTARAV